MQDLNYVYHIHKEGCSDLLKGYVGVTRRLNQRMSAHKSTGLLKAGRRYTLLFKGSRKCCLAVEKALRPHPYMGANTAEGGWDKLVGTVGFETRIKQGQHLSTRTEFKKGQTPHNAGATVYLLTDPDGKTYTVDNLTTFCKEHGLTRENVRKVARGNRSHCKGWKATVLAGR